MKRYRKYLILSGLVAVLIVGIGGIVTMGPRLSRLISRLYAYATMPVYDEPIETDGSYTNIIFLHHSTGQGLITEGTVRPLLDERGYKFWDHGYNQTGLVRPDGTLAGASYRIPGALTRGDTDVSGLVKLFSQPVTVPPSNAFSRLLQHEIIIFKSCFPNSAIDSDEMQNQFQNWYLQMRDVMDQHPDRIFIIVTSPPLHPLSTSSDEAGRARAIANWLKSEVYLKEHPNIFVIDFYDLLADPATNMLRTEYQHNANDSDSHPNTLANETIGPVFVELVDEAVQTYREAR